MHLFHGALDLAGAEATVPAEGPDGADLAFSRPARDRPGVDPEEGSDLGGREEDIGCIDGGHGFILGLLHWDDWCKRRSDRSTMKLRLTL